MKKLVSICASIFVITVLLVNSASLNVFASTEQDFIPEEVIEASEIKGEDIEVKEPGVYSIGDELFIDASIYTSPDEGQPASFEGAIPVNDGVRTGRAANPPAKTTVWSWSKGTYNGNIEKMSLRVFTNYRFTGYSNYNTKVSITGTPNKTTTGKFDIQLLDSSNVIKLTYNCTGGYRSINWLRVNSGEKYCFAVAKPNDGYYVTGSISVYGY